MRSVSPGVRFCAGCQREVHDLSYLSEDEAEARLASRQGRLCISYSYDADTGEIAFDVPEAALVRLRRRRPARPRLDAIVRVASAASLLAMLAACVQTEPVRPLSLDEARAVPVRDYVHIPPAVAPIEAEPCFEPTQIVKAPKTTKHNKRRRRRQASRDRSRTFSRNGKQGLLLTQGDSPL